MIKYLTQLRSDIQSHLENNIGSDIVVEKFWSDDLVAVQNYLQENQRRIQQYPYVLVTVPSAVSTDRRSVGTSVEDTVTVWCWVASYNNRDENEKSIDVEQAMLLAQAYLSNKQFGTNFTHKNNIDGWEKQIEFENEEYMIYSLSGNLRLELDLQSVISTYES